MFRPVVAIIRFYHSTHLRFFYTFALAACLMRRSHTHLLVHKYTTDMTHFRVCQDLYQDFTVYNIYLTCDGTKFDAATPTPLFEHGYHATPPVWSSIVKFFLKLILRQ